MPPAMITIDMPTAMMAMKLVSLASWAKFWVLKNRHLYGRCTSKIRNRYGNTTLLANDPRALNQKCKTFDKNFHMLWEVDDKAKKRLSDIAKAVKNADKLIRLLIAVDNSSDSQRAVNAVCSREWPRGTEVGLLAVVDTVMAIPNASESSAMKWIEVGDEKNWDQVRAIFEPSAIRTASTAR